MPNIHIIGYGNTEEARVVVANVRAAMRQASCADEIVMSIEDATHVFDLEGKRSPFLRVISGDEDREEVVSLLRPLGQDIEVIRLHDWIPKPK